MALKSVQHIKRYGEIIQLLFKYGLGDWIDKISWISDQEKQQTSQTGGAQTLAQDLQKMGPAFVKLGQLLSTQPALPIEYQKALIKLQDQADHFPFAEVERIFQEELGLSLKDAFKEFDSTPFAAASLSQIHRAVLPSGKEVAVKVQRPNIQENIQQDLDILHQMAVLLDNHTQWGNHFQLTEKVDELSHILQNELDFRKELRNLAQLRKQLARFKKITTPIPIMNYSSSRILVMEYIPATSIKVLSPVVKMEIDTEALADELFEAYLHQILIHGFWHMDPHPGNVYLTQESKLALFDFGMVGRITSELQFQILDMLLAISKGEGQAVAEIIAKMGRKKEGYTFASLNTLISNLIAQQQGQDFSSMSMGTILLNLSQGATDSCVILPPQFSSLAKTLLNLEQIVKELASTFDPLASIKKHAQKILLERLKQDVNHESYLGFALETARATQQLPAKMNSLLEQIIHGELQVKTRVFDEQRFIVGLQKIANRIAAGLVLAALIIGAALLMRLDISPKLLGFPALATVLLSLAVAGAMYLIYRSYIADESNE